MDGGTGMVVTVGLIPFIASASLSVCISVNAVAETVPWLLTEQTPVGNGLFTVTWNLMVMVSPAARLNPDTDTF